MSHVVSVKDVRFYSSATTLQALPDEGIPEVAVTGRSNVGKSTLINRLTGRKKLAFTSSVPGKTQSFHSYEVTLSLKSKNHLMHLVDLPGFGYAKFAKRKREYISRLTVDYIIHRRFLRGVLLLNDIRRDPEEDELAIQHLGFENEVPVIVVLTKADKVKKNEIKKRTKEIAKLYHLEPEDLIITGDRYDTAPIWQNMAGLVLNKH